MIRDKDLTEKLINYAKKIGIDLIGFADPKDFNRFKKNNRPEAYLSNCRSVIIVAIYMYDTILDAWSEDAITKKSYHFLDSILENRLLLLKDFLQQRNFMSIIIPYKPGIFLKDAGVLAGLGSIGKNNLLLTEEFGSQIRLRALATQAPLITGKPLKGTQFCHDCRICIEKCPINALSEGKYNKELCLSYNLSNLVKISKYTSIWCNICIEVCPYTKKAAKINFT
jgi:epoxyqueuosine reductase QueG